jgi:hypothetical protein
MKTFFQVALVLTAFTVIALAGPPDNRFDGMWIGTETTGPRAATPVAGSGAGTGTASMLESLTQKRPAKISIAKGGTMLAIQEGACLGHSSDIHRSGNVITFQAGDCKCELTLSSDGNTLTEKGSPLSTSGSKRVATQIMGTFHRQK